MDSQAVFESKIEIQVNIILNTDAEFWEIRNKAIIQLISLISTINVEEVDISSYFSPNFYRLLLNAIKSMILDLRSQQVRDTCQFLIKLSYIAKDNMKVFMRDLFPILLDALKVPNKVISGYVDDCILNIIKNTTFKHCLNNLVEHLRESKSKLLREHCIEYINEALIHWDISEKDADVITESIKSCLQDASVRVREVARLAYLNIYNLFRKKAELIKSSLPSSLRDRLTKAENVIVSHAPSTPMEPSDNEAHPIDSEMKTYSPSYSAVIPITPAKNILGLRARRQSCHDAAVTSIQAVIRGALTRRTSNLTHLVPSINNNHSDNNNTANETVSPKTITPKLDGSHLFVGMEVEVTGRGVPTTGIVRFVGTTSFGSGGVWVGIELPTPTGKNNGSILGKSYFSCPNNHGLFVKPLNVIPLEKSYEKNIDEIPTKTKKLCGLYKLKIFSIINIYSQQLKVINDIENNVVQLDINGLSENYIEELLQLNKNEEEIYSKYTISLKELLER